ncbi:hypothetical protein Tco_0174068 [Tanacetum coccineum]
MKLICHLPLAFLILVWRVLGQTIYRQKIGFFGIWTPLSEPLSVQNLTGAARTSGSVPATVATITALSTTFASTSSISPITVDDYEVVNVDGQENSQRDVAFFPTVDFLKEKLDTTPKRDLLKRGILGDFFNFSIDTSREFINHLAPPILFAQIRDMDYEELFTEFSVGTTSQACLSAKVRMRTEYSLSERKRLESECGRQADLLKSRDEEIENLKAQLLLKEGEVAEAARLRVQVYVVEAAAQVHVDELNVLKQKNVALEDEKNSLSRKIIEFQSSVSAKDLELKDLNVVVSSLRSHNDGLVDQVHMLETTCSGLREQVAKLDADLLEMACHLEEKFYPYLLTTISGRIWLLTHDLKLVLVKCLNSSEYLTDLGTAISRAIEQGMQSEADFNSALQKLREVDFPLLAELKSHKDASVKDIMNLLCLENIAAERSALMGAWTPLSEPLSIQNLTGAASTSGNMPAAVVTTTVLSTTFASTSSLPPITVDDYVVVKANGQENSQGNVRGDVASFPMVDFEKKELDTTLERDLLS